MCVSKQYIDTARLTDRQTCLLSRRSVLEGIRKKTSIQICPFCILMYFTFSFHTAYTQPAVFQLKDKVTGVPVEFAYILARQLNGQAQDRQQTDTAGKAELKLALPVVIHISRIDYKVYSDTITTGGMHTIMLSPDYYQFDQVVVTGQFRPQPVDKSIYKIEVIDARQIQLKAANNLGELLKTEPGFQFRSEGVLGDFIRIRGLTGEHVKILIDGMPVTGRVADRIDLGQLSLQNVDHVEVIEGPMSVVYGSNALAGAINIITTDYSGKQFHASSNGYYETIGTYNFNLSLARQIQNHTFSINAARNFFSGWGPVDTSRYKTWKPKLQYLTGVAYRYHKNRLKVDVNSDLLSEELRDPGALTIANLYEEALDGYHFTTRWNNRINLTNTFNDDLVMNLQAGYSNFKKRRITYLNDLVNLSKSIASDPDLHDTTAFHMFSGRGFVSNIPGKKFEYQTGFDFNYESATGKRTGGHREISDISGFMNLIYHPVTKLSLQPGIRLMHNSNYKAPVVYGLSVKFNPSAFTFKATYAKGFRAPSLKQLYLQFIDNNHEIHGNENLKAETADNISLSANYDLFKDIHAWGVELGMFYNAIEDAIQLAISTERPGWGQYFNVEGMLYKTKGMEFGLYYKRSPGLSVNAGIITTGRLRLDDSEKYAWSTDFVSSATYRFKKPGLQVALFYKYSDEYLEFAGNYDFEGNLDGVAQQYTLGYHTMDATVSKGFLKERLNISAGVKNIFDVTQVSSIGSINLHGSTDDSTSAGYGRTFFMSLGYTFDKL